VKSYPDSTSRQCLPCSANCNDCFSASFCINCASGYTMESGRCVASTTCPSGQYQYKSNCVSSCPVGTYMSGNTCVRSCTDSKNYFFNQICFPSCPTALRTADACVNNCPSGTTAVNGVCQ